jgi:hypothetical protein
MTPYAYRHMHTGPGTIEMAINRHRMAHAATSNLRLSVPLNTFRLRARSRGAAARTFIFPAV